MGRGEINAEGTFQSSASLFSSCGAGSLSVGQLRLVSDLCSASPVPRRAARGVRGYPGGRQRGRHQVSASAFPQAQAQSRSELDLRAGSLGSWLWKRRHSSGGPAEPLGRLQRPAVGSASDLANYASMGQDSLAPAVTSGEPAGARGPSGPPPAPGRLEQGSPGHTCWQPPHSARGFPLWPKAPSNLEDVLPHPASCPRAEGAKGEPTSPGPALPEPAQTLHERPSARRTRYYRITVSLQGREQAPGEETEEPKPAQPAPHPCGPEESRGWQEPPQGPRPITGCLADPPQEPQLRAPPHQGSTAQRQELLAGRTPGSPHRR